MVEYHDTVLKKGLQGCSSVYEAVRQFELYVCIFAQPYRVDARQTGSRTDAVVGHVMEFILESHAHLRQRPETELSVLHLHTSACAVRIGKRRSGLVDLLRREGVDEIAHGVERHEGVGIHPSQRIGCCRAVGLAPCQKTHFLLLDAGVV